MEQYAGNFWCFSVHDAVHTILRCLSYIVNSVITMHILLWLVHQVQFMRSVFHTLMQLNVKNGGYTGYAIKSICSMKIVECVKC